MNLTLLKEFFAGFLRTRHIARHFRRLALLENFTDTTVSREVPPTLAQTLVSAANSDTGQLLNNLGSHTDGLSELEADARRAQYGLNEVEHEQPLPWWTHLWHCYKNPFNLLLTLLAVISWLTEDMKAAIVIFSMVVLSTLLRFWQETKSNQAADALKAMVSNTATVLRR
ncbi:cation-transporting P-type ATPase, partial [Pseudomonas rossensis]